MKLKTLLITGILVSLSFIAILVITILSVYRDYEVSYEKSNFSARTSTSVSQLNSLTSEYLLYHQERVNQQWHQKHASLGADLSSSQFTDKDSQAAVAAIQEQHSKLLNLFEGIVSSYKKNDPQEHTQGELSPQEKALAAQLLTTAHVMSTYASKLAMLSKIERDETQSKIVVLSSLVVALFIMAMLFFWGIFAYRVVLPLRSLQKNIKKLDSSHLDQRVEISRNDEIGMLARSFNEVATELQQTVVSKGRLEQEIAERRRAEKELHKSSVEWSLAMDFFNDAICVFDASGRVVRANKSFQVMMGKPFSEIVGNDCSQLFSSASGEIDDRILEVLSGHVDGFFVLEADDARNPFGVPIEVTTRVIDDSGQFSGSLLGLKDLTQSRAEYGEKEQMRKELAQAQKMDALGQFTGGVAHDFNNIISIILGYNSLALEYSKTNGQSQLVDYLKNVDKASNRAKDLVAQMLTFSRSDEKKSEAIKIDEVVKSDLGMMRSIIPSNISIDFNVEDEIPLILMDPIKLQQILMNLCSNARDAITGNGAIRIDLRLVEQVDGQCSACLKKVSGRWVELAVSDTGSGMSPDIVSHIFDPFFTTKETGKGTGMGMSVLLGIVKSHGGHIIVETSKDIGTKFRLLFPPLASNARTDLSANNSNQIDELLGSGENILIVDDQAEISEFLSELLSNYGYVCEPKSDSTEALASFRANPGKYDLVITDQTMPELTGLELIRSIRTTRNEIPVILTTGYSDQINKKNAEAMDICYLSKPIASDTLLRTIKQIFEHKQVA